ncbi:reverse transcriptase domain-containing protein [Bilophila wadsworthia]|uniref:reverse transcriptase domain-containing protein n=1 Tax=Bilophila wadsworthia TaxID=35833 RepID=UPI0028ED2559|nr:reverse transcriptase domain-containing protein [Bilophila wadsworthia]
MNYSLPTHMKDIEKRVVQFKNAKTRQELAESIGYRYKFIVYFIFAKDIDQHYIEFNISKKYKGERIISSPNEKLKQIQKNIAEILLDIYKPKHCVHSFVRNKNVATNAKPHVQARHILRLDLENFFSSIHFGRVRNLFEATFNFPREVSTLLARICCFKGCLPQGAPTSPIISNMICLRMDAQLTRLANDCRCKYTRYADDITFSTNMESFNDKIVQAMNPLVISDKLVSIIESNNYFKINKNKTHICSNNDSKFITGVKVNKKLNVSRKKYREIRAMLHAARVYGHDKALAEHLSKYSRRSTRIERKNFFNIVHGKISYLSMIRGKNDTLVAKLKLQLAQLREIYDEKYASNSIERTQSKIIDQYAIVLTEGKTDRMYLSFAFRKLRNKGYFRNLKILFYMWPFLGGCTAGIKHLDILSKQGFFQKYSDFPKIYIFDRDIDRSDKYINKVYVDGKSCEFPKYWGENTWSFILHEPKFRNGYGNSISIEHFFSDNIIFSPDNEGRRLYSCSHFDDGTDTSNGKKIFKLKENSDIYFEAKQKKGNFVLIDDGIFLDGKNISRTKFSLAKEILHSNTIEDASLNEFKILFDVIEYIINKSR